MSRELWTLETRKQGIISQASAIAGDAWDDRVQIGTLAEQLRRVAYGTQLDRDLLDTDDLTGDVTSDLVSLARQAEELGL